MSSTGWCIRIPTSAPPRPGDQLEADQRADLGVQAAGRRDLPRRHALHRRRRGLHLRPRAQRAEQPDLDGPVHPPGDAAGSGGCPHHPPAHRGAGAADPADDGVLRRRRPQAGRGPGGVPLGTSDYNNGKAAIGTGPYKLASFTLGDRAVFTKNPAWWGPAQPWDKVTYRMITNDSARVAALQSGDVDAIDAVPTRDVARLQKDRAADVAVPPRPPADLPRMSMPTGRRRRLSPTRPATRCRRTR